MLILFDDLVLITSQTWIVSKLLFIFTIYYFLFLKNYTFIFNLVLIQVLHHFHYKI